MGWLVDGVGDAKRRNRIQSGDVPQYVPNAVLPRRDCCLSTLQPLTPSWSASRVMKRHRILDRAPVKPFDARETFENARFARNDCHVAMTGPEEQRNVFYASESMVLRVYYKRGGSAGGTRE